MKARRHYYARVFLYIIHNRNFILQLKISWDIAIVMSMYRVINTSKDDLLTRLLTNRGITSDYQQFLYPDLGVRQDPFGMPDMQKIVDRIVIAMKSQEKIMIFWDYDVDGVTSAWSLYTFFHKFLGYQHISIRLPHRKKDGYGIRSYHIDQIKDLWVSLIITVDNGITAIAEAKHAKELGLDMIITDHHQPLHTLPDAYAIINPHICDYSFRDLCGVWVVFKLISALASRSTLSTSIKKQIFSYFMPIVALGTVADCVPLIAENRYFVKQWLDLLNAWSMPVSLQWFIDFVGIKNPVTSEHMWYVLWPRINAAWRMSDPTDALKVLLTTNDTQNIHLQKLETLNKSRKSQQDALFEGSHDTSDYLLISWGVDYHEWVIGIVAGKLTEKYHKPSIVYHIDESKQLAIASLRWPTNFSVIDMLNATAVHLDRYWWHAQAWWCTIRLDTLQTALDTMQSYCSMIPKTEHVVSIDTILYPHECNDDHLHIIQELEPFGEWNRRPVFVIPNINISHSMKVWSKWEWHLKITWRYNGIFVQWIWRWKWSYAWSYIENTSITMIWTVMHQPDGWMIDIVDLVSDDTIAIE